MFGMIAFARAWNRYEPRLAVSLTPSVAAPDSHDVGTRRTRYGGPKLRTFGHWLLLTEQCSLGNPPREGRDPGDGATGVFRPSG